MYKKEDEWTNCFEVTDIKLPGVTYLGFSGETGELSDNHDIVKVESKNLYSPSGKTGHSLSSKGKSGGNKAEYKQSQSQQGGGWGWFFLKLVLFALAVVGAYVAFTIYRTKRRDRF